MFVFKDSPLLNNSLLNTVTELFQLKLFCQKNIITFRCSTNHRKMSKQITYDNFFFNACGDGRTHNLLHKFIIKKRRRKQWN